MAQQGKGHECQIRLVVGTWGTLGTVSTDFLAVFWATNYTGHITVTRLSKELRVTSLLNRATAVPKKWLHAKCLSTTTTKHPCLRTLCKDLWLFSSRFNKHLTLNLRLNMGCAQAVTAQVLRKFHPETLTSALYWLLSGWFNSRFSHDRKIHSRRVSDCCNKHFTY